MPNAEGDTKDEAPRPEEVQPSEPQVKEATPRLGDDGMIAPPRAALKTLFGLGTFAISIGLLYLLRGIVVPLFLAFLLAYALNPIVTWLAQHRVPRAAGGPLVMVSIAGLIALIVTYGVPFLVAEIRAASADVPSQILALEKKIEPWLISEFGYRAPTSVSDLTSQLLARLQPSTTSSSSIAQTVSSAIFGTLGYVAGVLSALIVPVFTIYLLMDFEAIVDKAKELIPRRWARGTIDLFGQIHHTLGGWLRGQLTANLVLGALYAVGLRIIDIRLAVPIGVLTGMLAFVPYVGFGFGLVLALAMATLDWQGPGRPIAVLCVMLGVQILDGFVITPRIVGRSVGLEPLEVLLTIMAAGTLFGFVGVFLAVPIGAIFKIVVGRLARAYFASQFYQRGASS